MNFYESIKRIEKTLSVQKISVGIFQQNFFTIAGVEHANLMFHSYKQADKSIPILRALGYNVIQDKREVNPFNAYFKYYITIKQL